MRNFFGRLLILIATIINFILLIVIIASNLFDYLTHMDLYSQIFTGGSAMANIFDVSIFILFLVAFVWVNVWCIKNIIVARSMRHSLIGTIVLFVIEILYFVYHGCMPGVFINNYGLFVGVAIACSITTFALMVGCIANYFKDCVN